LEAPPAVQSPLPPLPGEAAPPLHGAGAGRRPPVPAAGAGLRREGWPGGPGAPRAPPLTAAMAAQVHAPARPGGGSGELQRGQRCGLAAAAEAARRLPDGLPRWRAGRRRAPILCGGCGLAISLCCTWCQVCEGPTQLVVGGWHFIGETTEVYEAGGSSPSAALANSSVRFGRARSAGSLGSSGCFPLDEGGGGSPCRELLVAAKSVPLDGVPEDVELAPEIQRVPRLRPHAPEPAAGALRAGHGDRAGAAEPVRAGGRPEEAYPHRGGLVEVPRGGGRELPGLPAALGPGGPARRGLPARGREAAQRVPDARAGRLRGAAGGLRAHPAGAARGPAQHRRDLRLPGPGDGGAGRGPARAPADLRGRPVRAGGHDVPAALGHVPLRPAVQRARAAGLRRGLLGSPGGRGEAIRRPAAGQGPRGPGHRGGGAGPPVAGPGAREAAGSGEAARGPAAGQRHPLPPDGEGRAEGLRGAGARVGADCAAAAFVPRVADCGR
ncbi:unnamed protein product, partial [Prorocentrum cordatum]